MNKYRKPRLLTYPDKRLRKVSKRVVDAQGLSPIIRNMFGILGKEDGVALSAPQVNVPLQFFIARRGLYQHDIIVNPTWQPIENAQKSLVEEACLSLPGLVGQVNRWDEICVNYENINGEKFDKKLSNFHAQVFQHEVDHLNGILFIDHMRG